MDLKRKLIKPLSFIALCFLIIPIFTGCQEERKVDTSGVNEAVPQEEETNRENSNSIAITIGNITYTAELENNETAAEFRNLLPLSADMIELNGNEKYFNLMEALPETSDYSGEIHTGDLMLYGNDTVVLFYKDFETNYKYTPIGKIVDSNGLEQALGSGNVSVKFE